MAEQMRDAAAAGRRAREDGNLPVLIGAHVPVLIAYFVLFAGLFGVGMSIGALFYGGDDPMRHDTVLVAVLSGRCDVQMVPRVRSHCAAGTPATAKLRMSAFSQQFLPGSAPQRGHLLRETREAGVFAARPGRCGCRREPRWYLSGGRRRGSDRGQGVERVVARHAAGQRIDRRCEL
jgi:hypothetical protein